MTKKTKKSLLKLLEIFYSDRCAPYDWSFAEQEATLELIGALRKELKIADE